ncbi:DCN1-like protein 2 [Spinellus fusiger]|nr:DCN1-like protein 2 [Spinellus fusiger]
MVRGFQLQKVLQLVELTRQSEKDAQRLLQSSQWDVSRAVDIFYRTPATPQGQTPCMTNTKSINTKSINTLFDKYQDPDKRDSITVDGCILLCQDLGIEPTALEFLLVSHQLNSERMGEMTRQGFVEGCVKHHCDTVEGLAQAMQTLKTQMDTGVDTALRSIYNYAFLFGRQTGQKSLSLEAAIELWRLLLTGRFHLLDSWIQFLQEKHGKAISRDTWSLFYEFASQKDLNVDTHDADGAWPILIDQFVDYLQSTVAMD